MGTGLQHASGFHDSVEAELREILIGEADVIEREIGLRQIQSEAQLVGIIVGENEQRQMLHHGLQRHDDAALVAGPAASDLRDCGRITLHGRAGHGDGRSLGRTLRTGDKPRVLRGGVPAILAEADLVVVGGMADILPIHDGTAASGGNSATIQQERGNFGRKSGLRGSREQRTARRLNQTIGINSYNGAFLLEIDKRKGPTDTGQALNESRAVTTADSPYSLTFLP